MRSSFYLKQMEIGPMQNFVYLVGDREKKECFVVDPAWDVERILSEAKRDGMKITGALLTHSHYDHANGLEELLRKTDCKVHANKDEIAFLKRSPGGSPGIFTKITSRNLIPVGEGDKIKLGAFEIECVHTPGHTPGSQCFLVEKNLFAGDTLFIGYCGRCDLAGSSPEKMHESLTKLSKLDGEICIYPGHNYSNRPVSSLREEKQTNPYLKAPSFREFSQALQGLLD